MSKAAAQEMLEEIRQRAYRLLALRDMAHRAANESEDLGNMDLLMSPVVDGILDDIDDVEKFVRDCPDCGEVLQEGGGE